MSLKTFAAALVLALSASAAELPELRIEATVGASFFHIKNVSAQHLTAYLIELVGYPGSAFALLQDDVTGEAIAPGLERNVRVTDMTVGAAPEYVKVQAALYADGTSAGTPEKVAQLVEHRRAILKTTRELIGRLEKAQPAGTPKATAIADLKQWTGTMQPPASRRERSSPAGVNQAAARRLIEATATELDAKSLDEVLAGLRASERSLASSKPAL
jgi:hypothetical protein